MKLIITEKANAARRISTILSNGKYTTKVVSGTSVLSFKYKNNEFEVVSLRGHIIEIDYPQEYNDWSKKSPVELVHAKQVKNVRVKGILNAIKQIMLKCDEVIIATDFDREGELIGVETVTYATADMGEEKSNFTIKRAKFSALTKQEVEDAFNNLTNPDSNLAEAGEARQIVDLSWGAVLTRLISLSSGQVGKNFMSVGRVQSPTLKLLVDRHEEIENFVPVPYWRITGKFGMLAFEGTHKLNPFWKKEDAEFSFEKANKTKKGTVTKYETSTKEEYKPAPFDTTQMQVEANKIGIAPALAMTIAEDLYTAGYISYPRTENTEYPSSLNLKFVLEKLKETPFKKEIEEILSQDKIIPSKGKRKTTDHPPIYPTASATPDKIKGDKWKLYELIVRRFMATVATNAVIEITDIDIDVNGEPFESKGRVTKEMGWKKYYKPYIADRDVHVPKLEVGSEIDIRSMSLIDEETKPPYRYTQGSLIQEMDRLNLGTKSTRHDIISKLYSRNYVQGNNLIPTASGIALTKALERHGGGITEPEMTAKLETDMLHISDGSRKLADVVNESQTMLYNVATTINDNRKAIGEEIQTALRSQQHIGICKECGNNLTIRRSKNGNFIGCDGYPNCKCAYPVPKGAMIQTSDTKCEECGLPQLKVIRKGSTPQTVCIDPKCKSNTSKTILGKCPTCGEGTLSIMYSKAGKRFVGCSNWPKCNQTYPLRPKGNITPTNQVCSDCGAPIISLGTITECINMECSNKSKK